MSESKLWSVHLKSMVTFVLLHAVCFMMSVLIQDVYCSICGLSLSICMLVSCFNVLLITIIGLWPGARIHRLLARVSMPGIPVSAFEQIFRRAPNDTCTRLVAEWEGKGVKTQWPIDILQRAVMVRDLSRPPNRTSSFLKKPTLTKNPIERSMGVFLGFGWAAWWWVLGGAMTR